MELYDRVAEWAGWPPIVATLILLGSFAIWFLIQRLEHQKEINEGLKNELERLRLTNDNVPGNPIKYRAVIKLIHAATGRSLHSHNHNYQHDGSSRQQLVTAFSKSNQDDFWIVKGPHNFREGYNSGKPVESKDIIRLEHMETRRNLHSHNNRSPVSNRQEVTAYKVGENGDTNDNWKVEVEGGGLWVEGGRVRLTHCDTKALLHSEASFKLPDWGFNQQEVTCFQSRDHNSWWRAVLVQEIGTA